jgi:hypothetical protein
LNKETQAKLAMAARLVEKIIPEEFLFDGDGVSFLQSVYRDMRLPLELRIPVAEFCSRYERPMLVVSRSADAGLAMSSGYMADERPSLRRVFGLPEDYHPAIEVATDEVIEVSGEPADTEDDDQICQKRATLVDRN